VGPETYVNSFPGAKIKGEHLHWEIISGRDVKIGASGKLGLYSSDLKHRTDPHTFDINRPVFPYEDNPDYAARPVQRRPIPQSAPPTSPGAGNSLLDPRPIGVREAPLVAPVYPRCGSVSGGVGRGCDTGPMAAVSADAIVAVRHELVARAAVPAKSGPERAGRGCLRRPCRRRRGAGCRSCRLARDRPGHRWTRRSQAIVGVGCTEFRRNGDMERSARYGGFLRGANAHFAQGPFLRRRTVLAKRRHAGSAVAAGAGPSELSGRA
jgi:hypothetical protein